MSAPDGRSSVARVSTMRLTPDLALLATSMAAAVGVGRLTQAPTAAHVVVPIVAMVVVGHLATTLTRRVRTPVPIVLAAGLVTVALATAWGQLWSATLHGLPTATTWRVFVDRLDAAGSVIRSNPTPVPATSGVVLCIALGGGLAAVIGATLWAWQESRPRRGANRSPRPLVALVPSFGLLCYASLLSSEVDRVQAVFAYLVCALVFVVLADRPVTARSRAARGRRRLRAGASALAPASVAACLAVVVALAVSPGLSTMKVSALPFAQRGGAVAGLGFSGTGPGGAAGSSSLGGGGGPSLFPGVRAIDLVDDLQAVLTNRTTELMFSATSPVPTYWQLAVLTRFDGRSWSPDPATVAAINNVTLPAQSRSYPGLPALPESKPAATFSTTVTVADLQSTLLPLPPNTQSIGDANAVVVPGFGAVQPYEAAPGAIYDAVAALPARSAPRSGARSTAAASTPAPPDAASLAPYLELPSLPQSVVTLAHQIVAGTNGPAAAAAALAHWFDSGRFRYTLTPPVPPSGNALESFLFTTRQGFCQQFAAAYAVLARIDGLPARVAVGFTTGTVARGHYRVTGADAHVWPEVYLGPATGWTSFEPTPASSGEPNGVGVVNGARAGAQNNGATGASSSSSSVVLPARRPSLVRPPTPSTVPLSLHGRLAAGRSSSSGGPSAALLVLLALGGAAALAGAVVGGRRYLQRRPHLRLRWRRLWTQHRRGGAVADPRSEVLAQWRDAASALERVRLGRQPAETLHEHAARLESLAGARWLSFSPAALPLGAGRGARGAAPAGDPGASDPIAAAVEAYRRLAELASRASYGADPCTPGDAEDAGELNAAVQGGLARSPAVR
ncbi:MAG TPA: transglutaminaseTgpA domain-containing protein [Acidimicrobiales bacterium]|nr:transglutaminaseTgpA domain-containing protein [Acidimicrobiales bacterium]